MLQIPVMKPKLPAPKLFLPRLRQIQSSGVYSNHGPQLRELEERFALRLGVEDNRVVVLANATLAIQAIARLSSKKDWLLPSWTFVASALALIGAGKTIQFGDVNPVTQRLVAPESRLDSSLVTLPFGAKIPDEWTESDTPRLIDAAASLGNVTGVTRLGASSSIVFSLHATKYLGSGEGSVLVCGSEELAHEVKGLANFGFRGRRVSESLGTNAKMSEFQAAIAHTVLDLEDEERKEWLRGRTMANQISTDLGINLTAFDDATFSPYWIVKLSSGDVANHVENHLASVGIETRRWWGHGCHKMPIFSECSSVGPLTVTDDLGRTILGLPFFRGMTVREFDQVHGALVTALFG